jgi:hypothetical protein
MIACEVEMKRKFTCFYIKKTILFAVAPLCFAIGVNAQQAGDYTVAYGYSATSQARTAAPTPSAMAGTASFGIFLPANFLLAASTQTFTSAKSPGASRTWGYGVSKVEANHDWTLWKQKAQSETAAQELHFEADYTITLPTDGNEPPGVEHYAHQFLGMLDYTHSPQDYFEVDAGDLLGARTAEPGYKQTALLSLIEQHTLAGGKSNTSFDFELDASPSSEGAPASAVLTAGAQHTFKKSNITVSALALVGLTANDPAIGVALRIKFAGNLAKKHPNAEALNFSKLQRLESPRFFGKIGRF